MAMVEKKEKKGPRAFSLEVIPGLAGMFSDFFGLAIIAPLLPEELKRLNRGSQWVGYIVTGQYAAVVVGSFLMGAFADHFGEVVALSTCMVFDAVLFMSSGFASTAAILLMIRCLAGLFAPQGLAIAWISSVSTPQTLPARMGAIAGCIHLGILAGTAVGGFIPSWVAACLLSGAPPLFTLGLIALNIVKGKKKTTSASELVRVGRTQNDDEKDEEAEEENGDKARPREEEEEEEPDVKKYEKESSFLDVVLSEDDSNKDSAVEKKESPLKSALYSREFCAVFMTFFANGMQISVHFALLVVVLTEKYGFSRVQYSLTLMPASLIQMFNHIYVLPMVIRLRADPFVIMAIITGWNALFLIVICVISALFPDSPWPIVAVQNVAFWGMSFSQGVGNFASATHAAFAAPSSKGALIGLGRSAFNLGTAVGPSLLIAVYLRTNVRLALGVNALLYASSCLASLRSLFGDPNNRPPSYYPSSTREEKKATSDGDKGR